MHNKNISELLGLRNNNLSLMTGYLKNVPIFLFHDTMVGLLMHNMVKKEFFFDSVRCGCAGKNKDAVVYSNSKEGFFLRIIIDYTKGNIRGSVDFIKNTSGEISVTTVPTCSISSGDEFFLYKNEILSSVSHLLKAIKQGVGDWKLVQPPFVTAPIYSMTRMNKDLCLIA